MRLLCKSSYFFILLFLVSLLPLNAFALTQSQNAANDTNGFKIIAKRTAIEDEARALGKAGQYEAALELYRQTLEPQYWEYEWQQSFARGGIFAILRHQGRYDEALEALTWQLKMNPEKFEPWRQEVLALKKYSETNDPSLVYEHIEFIKEKYKQIIPPVANGSTSTVSQILRLYDAIGDLDAGIAYIDMNLEYFKTATEAKGQVFKLGGWHNEYLTVREAFEQDKAEGTKGRATRALIKSDYFPWA